MSPPRIATLALALAFTQIAGAADDKAKPKVNFQDNVSAIFQARCNSCHNSDKAKGGLSLDSFGAAMQGGGSGKVIEPGDVDGSHLWQLVSHAEEPKMPPNSPKIPEAELAAIKAWIEAGAPETPGSVVATKAKPKFEFKLDPSTIGKPSGPAAMPLGITTEPVVVTPKANAIVAMAASPWAPLVAIAGHKQVLLYETRRYRLVGVLPFPEGFIHVLKFSRNGSLLLAGGGRGGQSGLAVVFDVKTGKRAFEIGKEYDVVLAADISPDHGQVALGGPSKIVRIYNTADGTLQFEVKKHTEWVTALEFSPDGVLLATGDRNNGLIVWEAQTGREFFDLRGHTSSITDVTWRLDSNVIASSSEDGSVRIWEMENGTQVKSWAAHGGGITSTRFARDGRIVTTGRDRTVRVWNQDGMMQKELELFGDLALRAVFADEDSKVVAGDWSGEVRIVGVQEGKRLANLAANPVSISSRLEQAQAIARQARAAANQESSKLVPIQTVLSEKNGMVLKADQDFSESQREFERSFNSMKTLETIEAEKTKLQIVAVESLKVAQIAFDKSYQDKARMERAVGETAAAEKASAELILTARAAVARFHQERKSKETLIASALELLLAATTVADAEQAESSLEEALSRSTKLNELLVTTGKQYLDAIVAWEHSSAAKNAAPGLLTTGVERVGIAGEMLKRFQYEVGEIARTKTDVSRELMNAKEKCSRAKSIADSCREERDATRAAKQIAEKTVMDQKSAIEEFVSRAVDLEIEVEALTAELKAATFSRTATNAIR